jgi:hypothetical protein
MKQQSDLTPADFGRHPVWIGVHNYDTDEPWYEQSDEETFRPWAGPLPFSGDRGVVLVASRFELADGSIYSGYCRALPEDCDVAPAPAWSTWHGGSQLSVLALLNPTIFVDGHPFDFHLGIPERRKNRVIQFYTTIGKKPTDVFPLRFAADKTLAIGITSGKLEGFFYFPLGGAPSEIDNGESLLERYEARPASLDKRDIYSGGGRHLEFVIDSKPPKTKDELVTPELKPSGDLSLTDFERHPVWVFAWSDPNRPTSARKMLKPWTGPLPVDPEKDHVLIPATFFFRDGSQYRGYMRAISENWLDIPPPPIVLPKGMVIKPSSPRVRYGGSPLAIIGEQLPCLFVAKQKFDFWCGVKDIDELRLGFYNTLQKPPTAIFPIQVEGDRGLARGIVTARLDGFYEIGFRNGQPPKVIR